MNVILNQIKPSDISLNNKIDAVKDSMREAGQSFSSFVYDGFLYKATLESKDNSVAFKVKDESDNIIYKSIIF